MKKVAIVLSTFIISLTAQSTEEISRKVKASGLSEYQLRQLAKRIGLTDQQIDSEISEYEKKVNKDSSDGLEGDSQNINAPLPVEPTVDEPEITRKEESIDEENIVEEGLESASPEVTDDSLIYYGYSIFKNDPILFQGTEYGAIDPDYLIGPGDEIILVIWGETRLYHEFLVNREGFIIIPNLGQVFVNGLTLALLESKLKNLLSSVYATLSPRNEFGATSFMDVTLGKVRPLRVFVIGEVGQPGAYTVGSSATLFSSLYYFNGPTTLGSLRDIRLVRDGEKIWSVDFYNYLLTGRSVNDIGLQLDDVVFIPPRKKTVTIIGEVKRPAIYELKENEGIKDLLGFCGNINITAYLDRIQVDRVVDFALRDSLNMDRVYIDVNLKELLASDDDFPLQDGDKIQVFSVLDYRKNVISISGAVERPGIYDLGDSLRLSEQIINSGNLLGDAYIDRVDVIRINSDFTKRLIKLNLQKVLELDPQHDIQLEAQDSVHIYSLSEMIDEPYVSISGHIKRPGFYQLLENVTVYDLVLNAGGFLDEDFKDNTYLQRADILRYDPNRITKSIVPFNLGNVLENENSPENFDLKSGDEIHVYPQSIFNTVKPITIDGMVRNPGIYDLKTGMTVQDLILEAGGLSENIFRYGVEVARVEPDKVSEKSYAEIITLDMDNNYSVSNVKYHISKNPGEITVNRDGFYLEPYDYVSIRPDPFFGLQRKVIVSGAVHYPGTYSILGPDEKLSDILERAGGMRKEGYAKASQFIRGGKKISLSFEELIRNPGCEADFSVLNGDSIIIGTKPNIISVIGEVNTPGMYKYNEGKSAKFYIKLAGGFTPDANKNNVWVQYPDGQSKKLKRMQRSPIVEDGSMIMVDRAKEVEPINKTELTKEIVSILSSLATIIFMISQTS